MEGRGTKGGGGGHPPGSNSLIARLFRTYPLYTSFPPMSLPSPRLMPAMRSERGAMGERWGAVRDTPPLRSASRYPPNQNTDRFACSAIQRYCVIPPPPPQ